MINRAMRAVMRDFKEDIVALGYSDGDQAREDRAKSQSLYGMGNAATDIQEGAASTFQQRVDTNC